MNGWIKRFADGQVEKGSDYDVQNKKASWSRGRLSHIVSTELHHNGHVIIIDGTGEFWQSDDLEAFVGINHDYRLVTRRIQKKIEVADNWLLIDSVGKYKHFRLVSASMDMAVEYRRRLDGLVGKWFTAEIDVATGRTTFDFKEERI